MTLLHACTLVYTLACVRQIVHVHYKQKFSFLVMQLPEYLPEDEEREKCDEKVHTHTIVLVHIAIEDNKGLHVVINSCQKSILCISTTLGLRLTLSFLLIISRHFLLQLLNKSWTSL